MVRTTLGLRISLFALTCLLLGACMNRTGAGGGEPGTARNPCGNGVLELGEKCDPGIQSGPGACVAGCDDQDACTIDEGTGVASACTLVCQHTPVRSCVSGDGCCPAGCLPDNDNDCSGTCGDGIVDAPGETCDGDCPTDCETFDACLLGELLGSPATCTARCRVELVEACATVADGCCPVGCTSDLDPDCPASCGNGVVDPGETCDGDCPTTCDTDNCETAVLTGSPETCTSTCTVSLITACMNDDQCCPEGCTNPDDNDCTAVPNNGVGAPCVDALACQQLLLSEDAVCAPDPPYTDGYCTLLCASNDDCPGTARCDIQIGACLAICESGCREQYECIERLDPSEVPFDACLPIL